MELGMDILQKWIIVYSAQRVNQLSRLMSHQNWNHLFFDAFKNYPLLVILFKAIFLSNYCVFLLQSKE